MSSRWTGRGPAGEHAPASGWPGSTMVSCWTCTTAGTGTRSSTILCLAHRTPRGADRRPRLRLLVSGLVHAPRALRASRRAVGGRRRSRRGVARELCDPPYWGRPGRRRPNRRALPPDGVPRFGRRHRAKSVFRWAGPARSGPAPSAACRSCGHSAHGFTIWPFHPSSPWTVLEVYPGS